MRPSKSDRVVKCANSVILWVACHISCAVRPYSSSMSVDSKKPDHPVNLTPAFNHDTWSKYFPMPRLDAGMPKEEKLAK